MLKITGGLNSIPHLTMEQKTNVAVVYSYYEKNSTYKDNLVYFLKHAIKWKDPHELIYPSYFIVVNGDISPSTRDLLDRLQIQGGEDEDAVKVRVKYRANRGFDFGAYSSVLFDDKLICHADFQYFAFINTSVRGPFLTAYYKGHWLQPFIDLFTDDIHLVGSTINVLPFHANSTEANKFFNVTGFRPPFTHVQSQMFVVDQRCLQFLIAHNIFVPEEKGEVYHQLSDVIVFKEIMMSQLVLRIANWNISCTLRDYQGRDYRKVTQDFNPSSRSGDPCYAGACFFRTIHPFDVIFIKTNRNLSWNDIASLSSNQELDS